MHWSGGHRGECKVEARCNKRNIDRHQMKQKRKEREIVCGKKRTWLLRGMVAMVVVKVVAVVFPLVVNMVFGEKKSESSKEIVTKCKE